MISIQWSSGSGWPLRDSTMSADYAFFSLSLEHLVFHMKDLQLWGAAMAQGSTALRSGARLPVYQGESYLLIMGQKWQCCHLEDGTDDVSARYVSMIGQFGPVMYILSTIPGTRSVRTSQIHTSVRSVRTSQVHTSDRSVRPARHIPVIGPVLGSAGEVCCQLLTE